MTSKNTYIQGVTLIEVIIYIALFSILLGGAFISAYNLFESSDKNQTEAMIMEEGNFVLSKMSWTLTHTSTINTPIASSTANTLSVTTTDLTLSPIILEISGTNLTISIHNASAQTLTNTNVIISSLSFSRIGNQNAETLSVHFTLSAKTPDGHIVSNAFSETFFLTPQ